MRPFVLFSALLSSSVFLCSCGFTIIPPAGLSHPAPVFLLDHGRHASLVLPAEGKTVRYSYGDWDWYVLRKTTMTQGSRALFRSSPAALGRKNIVAVPSEESIRGALPVVIETIYRIDVERENIVLLQDRLELIFRDNRESLRRSQAFDLDFVHHPEPYTLQHNSNTVVAEWLRALGVEVRGSGPFSHWKIERAR